MSTLGLSNADWLAEYRRTRSALQQQPAPDAEPGTEPTGFVQAWEASFLNSIGSTVVQSLAGRSMLSDWFGQPDPSFNPVDYIKRTPWLFNDPEVIELADSGQFDFARNEREFTYELFRARQHNERSRTIDNARWYTQLAAGIAQGENFLIPGFFGATGSVAARIGSNAAEAAVGNVLFQKAQGVFMPAADPRGFQDDLTNAGIGALFGGGVAGALIGVERAAQLLPRSLISADGRPVGILPPERLANEAQRLTDQELFLDRRLAEQRQRMTILAAEPARVAPTAAPQGRPEDWMVSSEPTPTPEPVQVAQTEAPAAVPDEPVLPTIEQLAAEFPDQFASDPLLTAEGVNVDRPRATEVSPPTRPISLKMTDLLFQVKNAASYEADAIYLQLDGIVKSVEDDGSGVRPAGADEALTYVFSATEKNMPELRRRLEGTGIVPTLTDSTRGRNTFEDFVAAFGDEAFDLAVKLEQRTNSLLNATKVGVKNPYTNRGYSGGGLNPKEWKRVIQQTLDAIADIAKETFVRGEVDAIAPLYARLIEGVRGKNKFKGKVLAYDATTLPDGTTFKIAGQDYRLVWTDDMAVVEEKTGMAGEPWKPIAWTVREIVADKDSIRLGDGEIIGELQDSISRMYAAKGAADGDNADITIGERDAIKNTAEMLEAEGDPRLTEALVAWGDGTLEPAELRDLARQYGIEIDDIRARDAANRADLARSEPAPYRSPTGLPKSFDEDLGDDFRMAMGAASIKDPAFSAPAARDLKPLAVAWYESRAELMKLDQQYPATSVKTRRTGSVLRNRRDVPQASQTVAVLHRPGDANHKLLLDLQERFAQAGHTLHATKHPQQVLFTNTYTALSALNNKALANALTALPEQINPSSPLSQALNKLAAQANRVLGVTSVQGRNSNRAVLTGKPDQIKALMASLWGDLSRLVFGGTTDIQRGSAAAPGTFETNLSVENYRSILQGLIQKADWEAEQVVHSIPKRIAAGEAMPDGITNNWALNKVGDWFGITKQKLAKQAFDLYRISEDIEAGFELPQNLPNFPPILKDFAEPYRKMFKEMAQYMEDSGMIEPGTISSREWYLPAMFDVDKVQRNEKRFIETMIESFEQAESMNQVPGAAERLPPGAELVNPALLADIRENEIKAEALFEKDQQAIANAGQPTLMGQQPPSFSAPLNSAYRRLTGKNLPNPKIGDKINPEFVKAVEAMRMMDLPPDVRIIYTDMRGSFYRSVAQSVYKNLTTEAERIGTADILEAPFRSAADPERLRKLRVPRGLLMEFMVDDVTGLAHRYNRILSGRVASHMAVAYSDWKYRTLKDGTPVKNAKDATLWSIELLESLRDLTLSTERFADSPTSVPAMGADYTKYAEEVSNLYNNQIQNIRTDVVFPLDLIEGRDPSSPVGGEFFPWLTDRALQPFALSGLFNSGIIAIINDVTNTTMLAITRPRMLKVLVNTIKGLRASSNADLWALGVAAQDTNVNLQRFGMDAFGPSFALTSNPGLVRSVSTGVAATADALPRVGAKISGFNLFTHFARRFDQVVQVQVFLEAARDIAAGTATKTMNTYERARWNSYGLTNARAQQILTYTYNNGTLHMGKHAGKRINAVYTYDQFLSRIGKDPVLPGFDGWKATPQGRKLAAQTTANLTKITTAENIITSRVGNGPRLALGKAGWAGRFVVTFLNRFSWAFSDQKLRRLAQMPWDKFITHAGMMIAFGALTQAVRDEISGRNSLEKTAEQWETNPVGMMYAAVENSGMLGWLSRPFGWLDSVGAGPGTLLGSPLTQNVNRRTYDNRYRAAVGLLGPAAEFTSRWVDPGNWATMRKILSGKPVTARERENLFKALPYNNNIYLRMARTYLDFPFPQPNR
jgi:hypothetical protein